MAVNMTVQSGVVKSPSLRCASDGKVEYWFTLMQQEKDWPLYLPCFAPGAAGERLHEQLDEGMTIVITSGKLAYKKRDTKEGERSRLEILVWTVDRLTASAQVEQTAEASAVASEPETTEPPPAKAPRRRPYPKAALQGGFDQN